MTTNNENLKDPTALFYVRFVRKVLETSLEVTRHNRRMLQDFRKALHPGSDERAAVVREIGRHLRLERAMAAMVFDATGDMLSRVAELDQALQTVQTSPDADMIRELLQQAFALLGVA